MNLHLIYLLSALSVMAGGFLGYRTYHLQRHIRQELKALRVESDAKARQAKILAAVAAPDPVSTVYGAVTNPEGGTNAYGFAPMNRPVEIHNSYSL
ncbi:hypothetical protein P3T20_005098 [Paraburkholderia sp. GAS206C]|uniref:hypothetical protein n=1 Tax=unclassified Paraburkholderia TaxID=2615204 RepID=UPI003D1EC00E